MAPSVVLKCRPGLSLGEGCEVHMGKTRVLGTLPLSTSYSAVGHEFNVQESMI